MPASRRLGRWFRCRRPRNVWVPHRGSRLGRRRLGDRGLERYWLDHRGLKHRRLDHRRLEPGRPVKGGGLRLGLGRQILNLRLRPRFEAETRRYAPDDGVFNRRIDQGGLGQRIENRVGLGAAHRRRGRLSLTVLLLATGELRREPCSSYASSGPMRVREQRAFHPLVFEVAPGCRGGVVETPCDEAIPLIAHAGCIGIRRSNLVPGYRRAMRPPGRILSVNVAHVQPNPYKTFDVTGIDKRSASGPIEVRAPGMKDGGAGSGLAGDTIGDRASHGGDEQAVYAYAREDLDRWERELGRTLTSGSFGENLTTVGVDVNGALIGEQWSIGDDVILEVTSPRVPCSTFRGWMGIPGWLKIFTAAAIPGAYLKVVAPGVVSAGDPVVVSFRPTQDITVAGMFRSLIIDTD
jgi:MOSC domain-containing protein YiiM